VELEHLDDSTLDLIPDLSDQLFAVSPVVKLLEDLIDGCHSAARLLLPRLLGTVLSRGRSTPYCRT